MVILSKEAEAFLREHLPEALNARKVNDILFQLDDLIVDKGFVTWEEGYNDFGREAQKIYNDIYANAIEEP